jgi:glucose-1-phosphate thymidylyltransferase
MYHNRIRKALILAAGKGIRLRPLTYSMPKHIIPLANQPIISHIIRKLVNLGITDLGIIVGYKQELIKEELGDGSQFGAKIEYIIQHEPKGLAHAVKMGKDFVGADPFMVFLGDNILEDDLTHFMDLYNKENPDSMVLLKEVDEPQRFGIAILQEGNLVKVVEKPKDPPSNLAIAGVYIFDQRIFKAIDQLGPSWRGEYEITDAIQGLIDQNLVVKGEVLQGKWLDTGKPDDLIEGNKFLIQRLKGWHIYGDIDEESEIENSVYIGKGGMVRNSKIVGPVVIGKNCKIENSEILPDTSVGDDAILRDVTVENSLIMRGCVLENIGGKVKESILGKEVKLTSINLAKRCRLLLGSKDRISVDMFDE